MKYVRVLAMFQLLTFPSFSQQTVTYLPNEVLEWNEFYHLQWDDFAGARPKNAAGDAGTAVQIKATPFLVGEEVNYDVKALFIRSKSWSAAKSDALLAHERLHFDIAELYARKIRQRVAELQAQGIKKVQTYNLAIQELLEESNQIDMQYDVETLHGARQNNQADSAEKISVQLKALHLYKKKKRVVSAG